jgi:hypothetical protein
MSYHDPARIPAGAPERRASPTQPTAPQPAPPTTSVPDQTRDHGARGRVMT